MKERWMSTLGYYWKKALYCIIGRVKCKSQFNIYWLCYFWKGICIFMGFLMLLDIFHQDHTNRGHGNVVFVKQHNKHTFLVLLSFYRTLVTRTHLDLGFLILFWKFCHTIIMLITGVCSSMISLCFTHWERATCTYVSVCMCPFIINAVSCRQCLSVWFSFLFQT